MNPLKGRCSASTKVVVVHVQVLFRLVEQGQVLTLLILVSGREEVVYLFPLLSESSELYHLTKAKGNEDIGMVGVVH
jgi:hypothetical protein